MYLRWQQVSRNDLKNDCWMGNRRSNVMQISMIRSKDEKYTIVSYCTSGGTLDIALHLGFVGLGTGLRLGEDSWETENQSKRSTRGQRITEIMRAKNYRNYSPYVLLEASRSNQFLCVSQKRLILRNLLCQLDSLCNFLSENAYFRTTCRRIGSAVFGGLVQLLTYLQVSDYCNFWNNKRW